MLQSNQTLNITNRNLNKLNLYIKDFTNQKHTWILMFTTELQTRNYRLRPANCSVLRLKLHWYGYVLRIQQWIQEQMLNMSKLSMLLWFPIKMKEKENDVFLCNVINPQSVKWSSIYRPSNNS